MNWHDLPLLKSSYFNNLEISAILPMLSAGNFWSEQMMPVGMWESSVIIATSQENMVLPDLGISCIHLRANESDLKKLYELASSHTAKPEASAQPEVHKNSSPMELDIPNEIFSEMASPTVDSNQVNNQVNDHVNDSLDKMEVPQIPTDVQEFDINFSNLQVNTDINLVEPPAPTAVGNSTSPPPLIEDKEEVTKRLDFNSLSITETDSSIDSQSDSNAGSKTDNSNVFQMPTVTSTVTATQTETAPAPQAVAPVPPQAAEVDFSTMEAAPLAMPTDLRAPDTNPQPSKGASNSPTQPTAKPTWDLQRFLRDYDQVMFLEWKKDHLEVNSWLGPWEIHQTASKVIDVKNNSIFRIPLVSSCPYHGYVVSNSVNDSFFQNFNGGRLPEHASVFPLYINEAFVGEIICLTTKAKAEKIDVAVFEPYIHKEYTAA